MKLPNDSIEDVKLMISEFEDLITQKKLTRPILSEYQQRLDTIDEKIRGDSSYKANVSKLYELQALISYYSDDKDDARRFAKKALSIKKTTVSKFTTAIANIGDNEEIRVNDEVSEVVDSPIRFFYKSHVTVGVLAFFTFNIYALYWFYKQWRAIRVSTDKRTYPILSSIFQIFTVLPLFRIISEAATNRGYQKFKNPGILAAVYITTLLLSSVLSRLDTNTVPQVLIFFGGLIVTSFAISALLFTVQKAINYYELSLEPDMHIRKYYPGEITFATVGILISVLSIIGLTFGAVTNVYQIGTDEEVSASKVIMDSLTTQYDECSKQLGARAISLDNTSQTAVDEYNGDLEKCEAVRLQQNTAVDEYNRLLGY